MRKRVLQFMAMALAVSMLTAGCGDAADTAVNQQDSGVNQQDSNGDNQEDEPQDKGQPVEEEPKADAPVSVAELDYTNVNYDFAQDIAAEKKAVALVPAEADISLKAADANGATGVVLVPSTEEGNTTDYYLNAYVAGNELVFTGGIASASSSVSGDVTVENGEARVVPADLKATQPADEVIEFTMEDGSQYKVHTVSELLPVLNVTTAAVAEENAGVYHFALDHFMLSVDTDGNLVYYRNFGSVGELMAENFSKQITKDGTFYTTFVELRQEYRNVNGGYSSGMYVVMDENFKEIDYVTLLPNTEENHTHGEGYLDQHEFVMIGKGHYLTLSYTPEYVENIPENAGTGGAAAGYVWAGVFQEVRDGTVVAEINTTDYPLLYESAVEKLDYANSTDQGVTVTVNENEVFSLADGWQDYVHPNSLDYTLHGDGTVDSLLVSMRDQCAVYQFDMASGALEWILGGKASTLSGYEEFTSQRQDEAGNEFQALTYAQHYARYMNKNEDGVIEGTIRISVFDNQTGTAPFFIQPPAPQMAPNLTRTFTADIDPEAGTVKIENVINGTDLNQKSEGYHIASHCGSVDYFNDNSVLIGWGLHGVIDNIGPMAPEGTIADPAGYADLRQGSRPVFTEYDQANDTITFELYVTRNPKVQSHEALFSYRTYKTAD